MVKPKIKLLLLIIIIFLIEPLLAIDCTKAQLKDEQIICNNDDLRKYDVAMSNLYSMLLNSLYGEERNKLILEQKTWLRKRASLNNENQLLENYLERIRDLCHEYKNACLKLTQNIIEQWKKNKNTLNKEDSIIISSYLKSNLNNYIPDKDALKEIEEDINSYDQDITLDNVELHALDNQYILITVPLFMAAYQGQSLSFLYSNQGGFNIVRFPQFNGTLVYPYTHSNFADWVDDQLIIHNRSHGYLYECGSTQYYKFIQGSFKLIKETEIKCKEEDLEDIENGKKMPEDLKIEEIYRAKD